MVVGASLNYSADNLQSRDVGQIDPANVSFRTIVCALPFANVNIVDTCSFNPNEEFTLSGCWFLYIYELQHTPVAEGFEYDSFH